MDQHILDSLFTDIDRLSPEYVRFWKDLCTLEGRSDEVDNLNRVADFIVSRAESWVLRSSGSMCRVPVIRSFWCFPRSAAKTA